jgi:HPt (histidine-containing phosphotransfer) domain-containing protein
MTANALHGDLEHYQSVGMDDYLSKPIKVKELVRALQERQPMVEPAPGTPTVESCATEKVPASAPQAASTLDLSYLREFSEVMGVGGIKMAKELTRLYCKNSLGLIDELQRNLDGQDFACLTRASHTLKGNSSQIGATRLSDLCFNLEHIAKNASTDGAQALLEQVKEEYGKVESELEKVLQLSEQTWYAFNSMNKRGGR